MWYHSRFAEQFPSHIRPPRAAPLPPVMNEGQIVLLALGGTLAIASAGLSAIETAVFSMTEERRRKLRVRDNHCAQSLDALLERPTDLLNTLLLANTLANLTLIVVMLALLNSLGLAGTFPGWAVIVAVFGVIIVACDLLPKIIALAAPIRTTRLGMPLVRPLMASLQPVCAFLQRFCERLVALIVPKRAIALPHLSDAELETLVEIGFNEGTIQEAEARMIREVMKLGDKPARHCMTPRIDVFTIPDDLTNEEAIEQLRQKRYRRVPVRGATPDDLVGVIEVKQFLLNSGTPYLELLQPPSFVPETMDALALLQAFLNHHQHLAVLLDEFGGIAGIVTLSDLIEELLGEEGPDSRSELYIEDLGNDRFLAAGSARLDDLSERLGWVDDEEVDTIGGLVVEHLGFLPRPGAVLVVDGWRIVVRRATRKRIKEVLIERANETPEPVRPSAIEEETR